MRGRLFLFLVLFTAAACSSGPRPATLSEAAAALPPAAASETRLMVTLFPGPPQSWQRALGDLQANFEVRPLALWPIESLDGVPCVLMEAPPGRDVTELAARLAADPRVESAQPVYRFDVLAGYDDPYAKLQHAARDLRLAAAHRRSTGKGVKVAVVDTGLDFSHPELVGRVVGARDFVAREDRPGGAFTADIHGTGIAGVIAAAANNGVGIVGVAPDAQILAVKACWPAANDRSAASCDSYTLAQGLDFAIDQGAQVINLSLTGPRDPLLARLVGAALARGIPVVAAAAGPGGGGFPASEAGVLAVGTVPTDSLPGAAGPPLTAPGVDILTTVPRESYDFLSGSSLAAAHVSGVAALLLERRPDLAPAELSGLLERTAHPSNPHGAQVVDACAALAELLAEPADELCADG